jgi:hypothetical protein
MGAKDMLAGPERRRSKRVRLAFEIQVSGQDASGGKFYERAITNDVNSQGCQFDFLRQLHSGDRISIRLAKGGAGSNSEHPFEVVWAVPGYHGWTIGVTQLDSAPIWPVSFPENRIEDASSNVANPGSPTKLRMSFLDDFPVPLTCPSCGHKCLARIRQLKAVKYIFPCGHAFGSERFIAELTAAEEELRRFKQSFPQSRFFRE